VVVSAPKMTSGDPIDPYALGSTDAEHDRLIRQAVYLAPLTERLFREAGLGPGQRVLELGSGVGDVAMLVARLVGPSGEVLAIERDSRSIMRARARVAEAGLPNVSFTQCDISQIQTTDPFDAVVGRFILQFVPDPVDVLFRVSQLIRRGGVVAFQEVSYAPSLALCGHLPLWSATAHRLRDILEASGADTELGMNLNRVFENAGLPSPMMHMETLLGNDPDFTRWTYDLLCSLVPKVREQKLSLEPLGDFATLLPRLQDEVTASNAVVPFCALVGAWSRTQSTTNPIK
jgi:protein-L-isoaspartate O-methyltransferase